MKHAEQRKSLLTKYTDLVKENALQFDRKQVNLLTELEKFAIQLENQSLGKNEATLFKNIFKPSLRKYFVKGFYIHGGVGRGKTMLMDLFYNHVQIGSKKRVHFYGFMKDVHNAIRIARKERIADPLESVVSNIFKDLTLICFDEMQISDITDAMLIGRLFEKITARKVSFVCTSNRKPNDLYKDGLNRQLFLPFIKLLEEKLNIYELNSKKDYRRDLLGGEKKFFLMSEPNSANDFYALWESMTEGSISSEFEISLGTRKLLLPNFFNGIGKVKFEILCGRPFSARDYLSVFNEVKVLFLEDIPTFSNDNHDSCKRFISIVDIIYEQKVQLICLAASQPKFLDRTKKKVFEFERTVSRLEEMMSSEWP